MSHLFITVASWHNHSILCVTYLCLLLVGNLVYTYYIAVAYYID